MVQNYSKDRNMTVLPKMWPDSGIDKESSIAKIAREKIHHGRTETSFNKFGWLTL